MGMPRCGLYVWYAAHRLNGSYWTCSPFRRWPLGPPALRDLRPWQHKTIPPTRTARRGASGGARRRCRHHPRRPCRGRLWERARQAERPGQMEHRPLLHLLPSGPLRRAPATSPPWARSRPLPHERHQGCGNPPRVPDDDAPHGALYRVGTAVLERHAGPVGDYASYHRPDEGAVLEDLDQRSNDTASALPMRSVALARVRSTKKTNAATPIAVRNGLSRGLSRRLCSA